MQPIWQAIIALVPSVGVGAIFFVAVRSLVRADRNERAALARLDAQARRDADADAPARREADTSTSC